MSTVQTGRGPSTEFDHTFWYSDLGLPGSGTVSNTFLLYISQPVCGILLQQPKQTKTPLFTIQCYPFQNSVLCFILFLFYSHMTVTHMPTNYAVTLAQQFLTRDDFAPLYREHLAMSTEFFVLFCFTNRRWCHWDLVGQGQ